MENQQDYSSLSTEELIALRDKLNPVADTEQRDYIDSLIANKAQSTVHQGKTAAVVFHGKVGEYFSIWIVNLLLTIVTLGIYSAWAKVRNHRYFYANTEIQGHRFSYLATPMQILKGRIIALVLFALFYIASVFSPAVAAILALVYIFAMPWLLCKSIKFNMRMTGYRNIRFDFKGQYGRAMLVFIVYPILSVFTFYLAMPLALKTIDKFIIENTHYGDRGFKPELSTGSYYFAAFGSAIIAIVIFTVFVMTVGFNPAVMADPANAGNAWLPVALMATYLGIFLVSGSFYTAVVRNHMYDNTTVPEIAQFHSFVSTGGLVGLRLSNLLLLVCTLGLAIPWIKIRNARYFANNTEVTVFPGVETVIADQTNGVNAVGDELAELFDFDVAVG